MSRKSFQNEVPKARVNIRYKSTKDGKEEDIELPQRVVVIGNFTQNLNDFNKDVEEMKTVSINKSTFNKVMKAMNIGLDMTLDSQLSEGKGINAKLKFKSMKDFGPDAIVEQVPELNDLMKLRELLGDLKARVVTNKQFKRELERILSNAQLTKETKEELTRICLPTQNDSGDKASNGSGDESSNDSDENPSNDSGGESSNDSGDKAPNGSGDESSNDSDDKLSNN